MERYRKNSKAIFSLKLHIVWCTKYRRKMLEGKVADRLKEILNERAIEADCIIHALEVMPDHVHLFVEHTPSLGVSELVNRFKGRSSHILRSEFPSVKSRVPTLWTRSYFASSIGSVTEQAIQKYIENQKGQ